jgi:hypothetical protein
MKRIRSLIMILATAIPLGVYGQNAPAAKQEQFNADLEPVEFGFRYDDNIYRSVSANGRFSDGIYLLNMGGSLGLRLNEFKGELRYRLGADQYQLYSAVSNLKNNFTLLLSSNFGSLSLYYKGDAYFRNSQYSDFNYLDYENLLGAVWSPEGPWNYGLTFKNYSREYYDNSDTYQSRNFVDQAALLMVQREIGEKFSLKLEGGYNKRQFNRNPIDSNQMPVVDSIHNDETWTLLLNAHLYFESILQDINFVEQRTNSNSYGFSNSVQSVSWAAVVRPVSPLYLQLFFRLYSKNYDLTPLNNPDLQVGFIDEDNQDLLSIRTTWEFSPQWMASIGISRARSESTQPGLYYIKNTLTAQVRHNF